MWLALVVVLAIVVAALGAVAWRQQRLYRRLSTLEDRVDARGIEPPPRRRLRGIPALAPIAGYMAAQAREHRSLATLMLVATTAAIIALVAVDVDGHDPTRSPTSQAPPVLTPPGAPATDAEIAEPPEVEPAEPIVVVADTPTTTEPDVDEPTQVKVTVRVELPPTTQTTPPAAMSPPPTTAPTPPTTPPPTTAPPTTAPPPANDDDDEPALTAAVELPGLASLTLGLTPGRPRLGSPSLTQQPDLIPLLGVC